MSTKVVSALLFLPACSAGPPFFIPRPAARRRPSCAVLWSPRLARAPPSAHEGTSFEITSVSARGSKGAGRLPLSRPSGLAVAPAVWQLRAVLDGREVVRRQACLG